MCFILACNFGNVCDFLNKISKENRMFRACELYICCPFLHEIITAVSLIFYHIIAPFLVAIGAETQFGYKVLNHGQLLDFYPKLKNELKQLTLDACPLLIEDRLAYLAQYPNLCKTNKQIYKIMTHQLFSELDSLISTDTINVEVIKQVAVLICEEFLVVIDRQVDAYYGGSDSIVGKAVASNPDLMNGVPTTSLGCEHSVGTLRQSVHKAPSANMESHGRSQIIKTSPFFQNLIKMQITTSQLAKMMKDAKKSKCFEMYAQHKKDDRIRLMVEQQQELKELEAKRRKVIQAKNTLVQSVKGHGGPCIIPADVDKLCANLAADTKKLMEALWLEIKYQKLVIHSDTLADSALFLSKKKNKATNKYVDVPLEERKNNLKSIVKCTTGEEDMRFTIVPVAQFLEKAKAKHAIMKTYPHRIIVAENDKNNMVGIDLEYYREFYDELPGLADILVYYDDPINNQMWYPGRVERVNVSAECLECEKFTLPECNNGYLFCFEVKFMEKIKNKAKKARGAVNADKYDDEWSFDDNSDTYHVPVCQVITCKLKIEPISTIVVGTSIKGDSGKKRGGSKPMKYKITNGAEIEAALENNVLFMLKNA